MGKYIVKRILQVIPMLFILSLIVFMMVRLIPGDPVDMMLGMDIPKDTKEYERERLGLNDPLYIQYFRFVGNALHGDLGTSIFSGKPVVEELAKRFPKTLTLAVGGTLFGAAVGVLLGIIAAIHRNKFADNLIMVLSLLTVSTPSFFLALILMLIFCLNLRWLPSIGMDTWQGAILPIATLGLQAIGSIARTTRSAMLDVIHQDYIRTSRSRGVPERVITYRHAFKNALIPVLTTIGLRFGGLLAGATLVETVFSIPGIGRFVVDSVSNRDYPAIQGAVLVLAGLGYYREAAECYSRAIAINPFNWEYYRHRAHRFVSCGYFADGAADFTIASRLNPNDWNVWYHLGLSYFLLGMYDKADWAYTRCAALSKTADDICAVTDWHYMTLKRLGKDEEAAKLLDEITEDMPVSDEVANSYYQRLRVYKGLRAPETLFTNAGDDAGLDVITQGFGVANYYRMNGQEEKGVEMLKKVVYTAEHSKWYAAFGCLAARVDLKNIGQA